MYKIVILCLLSLTCLTVTGQNKTALLIANGDYEHFTSLANPIPEGEALKEVLEALDFQVTLVTNASKEKMVDSIIDFEATLRGREGVAFFHYGGHAVQVEGRNYLIPADANIPDERRVDSRAVNTEEIMAALELSGSDTNIVILDSCRNNPLPAGTGRSAVRGLAIVGRKPPNSVIVYSAESGTVAQDGVFTPTLIQALKTPELSLQEMLMQTRQQVYNQTGGTQIPGEYNQLFKTVYLSPKNNRLSTSEKELPGGLTVVIASPASLTVNGRDIEVQAGESIPVMGLKAGEYDLKIKYVDGNSEDRTVEVVAGTNTLVNFEYAVEYIPPKGFVYVKAGSFIMGSPYDENRRDDDELQHNVTLSRNFIMSETEVTQSFWDEVMDINPSDTTSGYGADFPVNSISWNKAVEFCNKLSLMEELTPVYSGSGRNIECDFDADGYRLPTEAEWEFAARGGVYQDEYNPYSGSDIIGKVGWFKNNSGRSAHPVAEKDPNSLGLYDMSGNVMEWCWDNYGAYEETVMDPVTNTGDYNRILRGGSWHSYSYFCRTAYRSYDKQNKRFNNIGFRIVRTVK